MPTAHARRAWPSRSQWTKLTGWQVGIVGGLLVSATNVAPESASKVCASERGMGSIPSPTKCDVAESGHPGQHHVWVCA
jgi:hypothetical protein